MQVKILGQYGFTRQASTNFKILLITVIVLAIVVIVALQFSSRKKFPLIRRITSLSLLFLGIASGLTGIALLLTPGKLEDSAFLGIARSAWAQWHTVTSILLIGFGIIHLYLNVESLKRYFGLSKTRK